MAVRHLTSQLWHSPTAMSWASIGMRALSVFAVLPLLLTRFAVADLAVWYLLMTLIGLVTIADVGFAPTFSRVLAYAMAGSSDLLAPRGREASSVSGPHWETVERIWSTMQRVYTRLSLLFAPLALIAGTAALVRPIAATGDPTRAWIAWSVVAFTFAVSLRFGAYGAFIQGVDEIALFRRWEALFGAASTVTAMLVLLAGGGLLELVIANQGWLLAGAWRDRLLARHVIAGRARRFRARDFDPVVFSAVWGSAVRSGIGVAMSRGVIMSSGIILAQVARAPDLAAYLLATRVMQLVIDLANAPFYSRLPRLASLWGDGRDDELAAVAGRGMLLTYWTFVLGVAGAHTSAMLILPRIGANVEWVATDLWLLMSVAYFIERFGALHLQLYSTTNDIRWHIANGVTGTIYLALSLALLRAWGAYAFPVGMLVAYASFYSWYGPLKVWSRMRIDFWGLQRRTVLGPALALTVFAILALTLHH